MSGKIGVSVVGIGGYGRSHLDSIAACSRNGLCTLRAVTVRPQDADREAEARLEAEGVTVYRDFGKMLESESTDPHLVSIPAGIPSHRPLTVAALDAGRHVLCEKPVAGCVSDAEAMRDAQHRSGRILSVGYQFLYSAGVAEVKASRVEGRWGALKRMRCLALVPRTGTYYDRNEWAGTLRSGGVKVYDSPAQNAVAHFLHLMLYLAGESVESSARARTVYGECYRAKQIESADTQFIRIHTDTDVDLDFWCSHAVAESHDTVIALEFDRARLEFRRGGVSNGFFILEGDERRRIGPEEDDADIRRHVFENTFEVIRTGERPKSTIDNGIVHTEVIETLFERCSSVVPVPDVYVDTIIKSAAGEGPAGENRVIRGIDELAIRCFERGESFAEAGAPWAIAGEKVELR